MEGADGDTAFKAAKSKNFAAAFVNVDYILSKAHFQFAERVPCR